MAGRPTKLTPEIVQEVRRLVPTVCYMESVGDYLGVSRQTWRGWLRRGRKEADRLAEAPDAAPRKTEALYLEFFTTFKRAVAEGEITAAAQIALAAGGGVWQAAAWRLERLFPERWGSSRQDIAEIKKLLAELAKGKA